jgi:hypothetical protein
MAGHRLNEWNFDVLRHLRTWAAADKGWEWNGVKGWISTVLRAHE